MMSFSSVMGRALNPYRRNMSQEVALASGEDLLTGAGTHFLGHRPARTRFRVEMPDYAPEEGSVGRGAAELENDVMS